MSTPTGFHIFILAKRTTTEFIMLIFKRIPINQQSKKIIKIFSVHKIDNGDFIYKINGQNYFYNNNMKKL